MVRVFKLLLALLAAVFLVGVAARWMWHSRFDQLVDALDAGGAVEPGTADGSVPLPVARYLAAVISADREPVTAVDLDTAGEFFAAPGGWKPFHAQQRFNAVRPGFVWDARIEMMPFAPVFVRDAYVDGRGEMVARVLALYGVANEAGGDQLAEGQLSRYLAEMIWFPTALRPGHGVTWTPIDDHAAMAHLTDRGHSVSLRFTFNGANNVVEVFAPARMRAVDGRYIPTPWAVRCWDHQVRLGVRIPIACEAEWQLPDGPLPYWRGRVTNIRFD